MPGRLALGSSVMSPMHRRRASRLAVRGRALGENSLDWHDNGTGDKSKSRPNDTSGLDIDFVVFKRPFNLNGCGQT